jgi:hypothetical protein
MDPREEKDELKDAVPVVQSLALFLTDLVCRNAISGYLPRRRLGRFGPAAGRHQQEVHV